MMMKTPKVTNENINSLENQKIWVAVGILLGIYGISNV